MRAASYSAAKRLVRLAVLARPQDFRVHALQEVVVGAGHHLGVVVLLHRVAKAVHRPVVLCGAQIRVGQRAILFAEAAAELLADVRQNVVGGRDRVVAAGDFLDDLAMAERGGECDRIAEVLVESGSRRGRDLVVVRLQAVEHGVPQLMGDDVVRQAGEDLLARTTFEVKEVQGAGLAVVVGVLPVPGVRQHLQPTAGERPRNAAAEYVGRLEQLERVVDRRPGVHLMEREVGLDGPWCCEP